MRNEVRTFVAAGPLPATDADPDPDPETDADPEERDRRGRQLEDIPRPVTAEEATAPAACSGPDDCCGVARTLLHLIETAPGPPPAAPAPDPALGEDDWQHVLHRRRGRSGGDPD
ncbi:hypothetical protein [Kitasatospora sp. NPDC090308]|uniref:hypothetical protein n=1 Tax=Kitasatospora sp. NPDC090308 TaxID=3364082 RepID=UPI0038240DFB